MNGEGTSEPQSPAPTVSVSPPPSNNRPISSSRDDVTLELENDRWDRFIPQSSVKQNRRSPTDSVTGKNDNINADSEGKLIPVDDNAELSALHTQLKDFPSLEDLSQQSNQIFERIKANDYNGLVKILSERGHRVDIVPKIGCSHLHYTKFNIANTEAEDQHGDTPLIAAAKVSHKMVDIILKYGGNPNATNQFT